MDNDNKVVDLMLYRMEKIEKSLKANGYIVKKDADERIKILMKIRSSDNDAVAETRRNT